MVYCFSTKSIKKKILVDYEHRMNMVNLSIFTNKKMVVMDIEYGNTPSYTIDTLIHVKKKYPYDKYKFFILLGKDSFFSFSKWKNYKIILNQYDILVYPRSGIYKTTSYEYENKENIVFLQNAPIIEISSSFIRNSIRINKNIKSFLNEKVWIYIHKNKLYSV